VRTLDLAATKGCESVEREDDECFAEALRLAYVALTRARHRVTLWWGGAKDAATSPLGWLLHGERGDGATPRLARTAVSARLKGAGDEVLRARLLALQAAAPAGAVAVVDEEGAPPGRHAGAADEPPALAARPWTRTAALDDGWRLGSFTGLTAGAHATYDPRAAADADDPVGTPEALGDTAHDGPTHDGAPGDEASDPEATSPGVEAPVPLAAFPRSAAAGIFFHEVLERHDVAEPAQLAERVGAALAAHGFGDGGWTAVVTAELARTLEAPLARAVGGTRPLRLVEVPAGTRLAELRFELPAVAAAHAAGGGEITPAALARAIAEHPGGALDRPGSGIMRADYADGSRRSGSARCAASSPARSISSRATATGAGGWWTTSPITSARGAPTTRRRGWARRWPTRTTCCSTISTRWRSRAGWPGARRASTGTATSAGCATSSCAA
jgi:ATP-dependent exoDNAse (exonuclease V) beta subunit